MKFTSLQLKVPPKKRLSFVSPTRGAAYKAWQERWQALRTKDWEWSTVPAAMAAEAVDAMVEDLEARAGGDALTTALHILTAVCMEVPASARHFKFTLPDTAASLAAQPMQSVLEFAMTPSAHAPSGDSDPALAVSLQAETADDTARLERLGILNKTAAIPGKEAVRIIDEVAAGNARTEAPPRPVAPPWSAPEVHAALMAVERAWPGLSSPFQAYPVVAGRLLHKSAVRMQAAESSIALEDTTFGRRDGNPPQDVRLSVRYEPVTPANKPHPPRR